jgi:hypothetical protein
MIGRLSTTQYGVFAFFGTTGDTLYGVFEAEPDFIGTIGDTLVGVFPAAALTFGGSTGDTLTGVFGPSVPEEEGGGVGFSWFTVELTSEHAYVAGEGGVGHSWFVVEVTEDHVEPPAPPTPIKKPGPVHRPRKRRQRVTYRIPGRFTVVESIEVHARGRFYADRERRFAGTYAAVASVQQAFDASYAVSDLHLQFIQEEDELLLLLLEDE